MSRYGSVTIASDASLITRVVQSAEPDDLSARANAAIAALPAGYVVVGLTLAGAGDGATFTVTVEAGLAQDVVGGFTDPPVVTCFLASEAGALLLARQPAGPQVGGVFADTQLAGASKGTRFMGMVVDGEIAAGSASLPFSRVVYVDPDTITPAPSQDGSDEAPYASIQAALTAHAADTALGIIFVGGTDSVPATVPGTMVLQITGSGAANPYIASLTSNGSLVLVGRLIFGALSMGADAVLTGSGLFDVADLVTGTYTAIAGNLQVSTSFVVGGAVSLMLSQGAGFPAITPSVSPPIGTFQCLGPPPGAVGAYATTFSSIALPSMNVSLQNCVASDVAAVEFRASGSILSGGTVAAAYLLLNGCGCESAALVSGASGCEMIGCKLDAACSITNSAGLTVDAMSNYWIKNAPVPVSNPGGKVVAADITP